MLKRSQWESGLNHPQGVYFAPSKPEIPTAMRMSVCCSVARSQPFVSVEPSLRSAACPRAKAVSY
jgi:hypothetical protein